MVAPAFAMASDVPPMAKLPRSTDSAGSAGGLGVTSTEDFATTQGVAAKYFLSSCGSVMLVNMVLSFQCVLSVLKRNIIYFLKT